MLLQHKKCFGQFNIERKLCALLRQGVFVDEFSERILVLINLAAYNGSVLVE